MLAKCLPEGTPAIVHGDEVKQDDPLEPAPWVGDDRDSPDAEFPERSDRTIAAALKEHRDGYR